MASKSQIIQSLIGDIVPYVFIGSIKFKNFASLREEDTLVSKTSSPSFRRNRFGKKIPFARSEDSQGKVEKPYIAEVTFVLNDLLNNSHWYNTGIAPSMNIKVLQSDSEKTTKLIKDGSITDISDLKEKYRDRVTQKIIKIPSEKALSDHVSKELEDYNDKLCSLYITEKFLVKSNHLTFFAFCEVEGLGQPGRRTIQRVLHNNKKIRKSHVYYLPDGKVWKGPIHKHSSKGWMAGAKHTSRYHPTLERVEHLNNKIQDYHIFDILEEKQQNIILTQDIKEKGKLYSDLSLSRDQLGQARGLFVFDIIGFLRHYSRLNGLISKRNVKEMLFLSEIKKLSIIRTKVVKGSPGDFGVEDQRDLYDVVCTSRDIPHKSTLAKVQNRIDSNKDGVIDKTIGAIREIKLAGTGNKRTFTFVDSEIAEFESGKYKYGFEISVEDPTTKFIKTQIQSLEMAKRIIISYYNRANRKRNFIPGTTRFSPEFLKYIRTIYNLGSKVTTSKRKKKIKAPWRAAAVLYIKVLENLTDTRFTKSEKLDLYTTLYPVSGDLEGVEKFILLLDGLINKLSFYDLGTETTRRGSVQRHGSKMSNLLLDEKTFKPIFNAALDKNYGFNYFRKTLTYNSDSLPVTTRRSLINRFNVEVGKFFPEAVGKRKNEINDPYLEGFRRNYYSYLSPMAVNYPSGEISFAKLSKLNEKEQKDLLSHAHVLSLKKKNGKDLPNSGILSDVRGEETEETLSFLLSELGSVGATITSGVTQQGQSGNNDDFVDSVEYVGETDNFKEKETQEPSNIENQDFDDRSLQAMKRVFGGTGRDSTADFLGASRDNEKIDLNPNQKDSIQARSYKKKTNEGIDIPPEQNDLVYNSTVKVEYTIGYDSKMQPIIKADPPLTALPFVATVKTKQTDSTGNFVDEIYIYDNSILVYGSGQDVTETIIKDEEPCDEIERGPEEEEIDSLPPPPTNDPCPPGMSWNVLTGRCEDVKVTPPGDGETSVVVPTPPPDDFDIPDMPDDDDGGDDSGDSSEDTVVTTNPEEEMIIVSQPSTVVQTVEAQTIPTATSEQQQAYFRRVRVENDTPSGGSSNGY